MYYTYDWNNDDLDIIAAYDMMARGADIMSQHTNGLGAQRVFGAANLSTIGIFRYGNNKHTHT